MTVLCQVLRILVTVLRQVLMISRQVKATKLQSLLFGTLGICPVSNCTMSSQFSCVMCY